MAGRGDNRGGGTGALELGLMNALRTGNRNVNLFVVAFLPTLIALIATSSERLRDVIRCVAGNGLRRKRRFERIVRVEWRPTRWGRGSKIEPEAKNEVLQKAIAWHLVRCGALDGADDAKLRLMARGAAEKGSGKYNWNKSFGTTSALLKQYDVIAAVPDDVWISIPGAPGDLKAMRAVDDGENSQERKEGEDTSTTSVDFRLACDLLAPIETFLETAFDAYVRQTAKEEAGGRHLYVRAGGGGSAKDDDEEDKSGGAATYKRYRLAASKTFDSLFFPEKKDLLKLLDAFHAGTGRFAVRGSPKKLGVLLHGPPGTGKTSLIKALAARLDRNIVSISLGGISTNQALMDAVMDLKYNVADADVPVRLTFKQTIFVLEDVDAASTVVHKRSSSTPEPVSPPPAPADKDGDPVKALLECLFAGDDKPSGPAMAWGASKPVTDRLDLSGILNVLDGVVDTPDRILVMTTNHPEKLDPALVRPGRVDVRLRLGYVQRREARQMVEHYVLRRPMETEEAVAFDGAWDFRSSHDVTPAELEQTCAACGTLAEVVSALADGDGRATRWVREETVVVA